MFLALFYLSFGAHAIHPRLHNHVDNHYHDCEHDNPDDHEPVQFDTSENKELSPCLICDYLLSYPAIEPTVLELVAPFYPSPEPAISYSFSGNFANQTSYYIRGPPNVHSI